MKNSFQNWECISFLVMFQARLNTKPAGVWLALESVETGCSVSGVTRAMGAVWLFAGRAKVIVSWRRIFSSLWNGKLLTKTTPFCQLAKRKFAQWRVRRLWERLHKQVFLQAQRAPRVHFSYRSIFCNLLGMSRNGEYEKQNRDGCRFDP